MGKGAKQWRNESPFIESMKSSLQGAKDTEKKEAEAAAEAKRKEDEANGDDRKKNLEELEKKRARKKQLEEERANRDPWLNDPTVVAAQTKLDDLKEQRRDAAAKLEFDVTNQLTKDISTAERELKKA